MPTALSFFVAHSEYSSDAAASDTMTSSEQHSSSSSGSSNSSTDQRSVPNSMTYIDATELRNSEAPTSPSEEVRLLISSSTSSGSEAIEIIANTISDGQVPWAFYVDAEVFAVYLLNRHYHRSQNNEDEEYQGNQNPGGDGRSETITNGTYGDLWKVAGRSGEVRERMLPRRSAVNYQFARRGEMS